MPDPSTPPPRPPAPRLLTIVGTRPEAIKMSPVAAAIETAGLPHRLVATGQHDELFEHTVAALGMRVDRNLTLGSFGGSVDDQVARIRHAVADLIAEERPDLVLVQGDTSSALAAALAADDRDVAVGHVEAGLRSFDLAQPWPEEGNRIAIDGLSTLLFAPTAAAAANLGCEPDVTGRVVVTGNSGIDALIEMRARLATNPALAAPLPQLFLDRPRRLILVTCHRRENLGPPLGRICDAITALAARGDVTIALPVHPNPQVREVVTARLGGIDAVLLLDPLDYPQMVWLIARAHLILTDSGGLQEEAPALGVPTLVLRAVTERPEALATGNLALVGTDPATILARAHALLDDPAAHAAMAVPAFPYGRGDASARIVAAICEHFGQGFSWIRDSRADVAFAGALPQGMPPERT